MPTRLLLSVRRHDMRSSPVIMSIADAILVEHGIIFQGSQIVSDQQTIADVLRRVGLFHGVLWEKPPWFYIPEIRMEQLQIVLMMRT